MSYASIVITASGARDDQSAVSVGFELVKRHRAAATVVIAVPAVTRTAGLMAVGGARSAPVVWQALDDSRSQLVEATLAIVREEAARRGLAMGATDAPPSVVATLQTTEPWIALQQELPLTDLVVMGPSAARGEGSWTGPFAEALMSGRSPVLITGDHRRLEAAPAALAWDGSPEAGRAVRAAVPLLRDAANVIILQDVDKLDASPGGAADPERLTRYLHARGVPKISVERVTGAKPGPAVLQTARSLDVALLVAGAFGHARLAEAMFGGATRTFLHAEERPHLFLSH